ncbi:unnamed protein product [Paramecium pentaurelia]|uniref:VTT domain-containing protein n=1 Tax=Paramecium pentaurelia TaxID=43138 RepID=A0A8S1SCX4_9CILI|nr:unnamed protein product [Paramecium pentaurelia]
MSTEIDINKLKAEIKNDKQRRLILFGIFATGLIGLYVLVHFSPHLTQEERKIVYRIPKYPHHIAELLNVINRYTENNQFYVLFAFIYLYIFMQSFAIPGPVFLSLLSGQLFGPIPAFLLVCLCATTGASLCYGLSYSLARGLVLNRFPNQIVNFNKKIHKNRDNLFFYMLFLRFTPLIPNVSINVSGPIVGLPFKYFFFGTLFGLMPGNIIHIRTGLLIQELNDFSTSYQALLTLIGLSLVALLPTLFKKKLQELDEKGLNKSKNE